MSDKRPLTEAERKFVAEAEAGGFGVGFGRNGEPFALGAEGTDNLFSMEVESERDGDQWIYYLRD